MSANRWRRRFPTDDTQALYEALIGPLPIARAEDVAPQALRALNEAGWFLVPRDQVAYTIRETGLQQRLSSWEDERSADDEC